LLLQKLRNSIGVVSLQLQAPQNQHLKSPLQQFKFLVFR